MNQFEGNKELGQKDGQQAPNGQPDGLSARRVVRRYLYHAYDTDLRCPMRNAQRSIARLIPCVRRGQCSTEKREAMELQRHSKKNCTRYQIVLGVL